MASHAKGDPRRLLRSASTNPCVKHEAGNRAAHRRGCVLRVGRRAGCRASALHDESIVVIDVVIATRPRSAGPDRPRAVQRRARHHPRKRLLWWDGPGHCTSWQRERLVRCRGEARATTANGDLLLACVPVQLGVWIPMLFAPTKLQYLHYVGSLGPLTAAVVMRYRDTGRAGVCGLLEPDGSMAGMGSVVDRRGCISCAAVRHRCRVFCCGRKSDRVLAVPRFEGIRRCRLAAHPYRDRVFFGLGEETGVEGIRDSQPGAGRVVLVRGDNHIRNRLGRLASAVVFYLLGSVPSLLLLSRLYREHPVRRVLDNVSVHSA